MNTFKIKGFTLIELMVVIAIIGLLSSVVLASLGNTKLRARDTAVRQLVGQMRSVLATQYAENPNNPAYYIGSPGWLFYNGGASNDCATAGKVGNNFTAANAANITALCNQIATLTNGLADNILFVGTPNPAVSPAPCNTSGNCYTIMVRLPSTGAYYCASGKLGTPTDTSTGSNGTTFAGAGCWNNP